MRTDLAPEVQKAGPNPQAEKWQGETAGASLRGIRTSKSGSLRARVDLRTGGPARGCVPPRGVRVCRRRGRCGAGDVPVPAIRQEEDAAAVPGCSDRTGALCQLTTLDGICGRNIHGRLRLVYPRESLAPPVDRRTTQRCPHKFQQRSLTDTRPTSNPSVPSGVPPKEAAT